MSWLKIELKIWTIVLALPIFFYLYYHIQIYVDQTLLKCKVINIQDERNKQQER